MNNRHRKLESKFVRHVMPDVTEEEIQEATERWFRFLNVLADIVEKSEETENAAQSPLLNQEDSK